MSRKGHRQPSRNKNKDQAFVERHDELLPARQKQHFDPIELKPRRESLRNVQK